MPARIHRSPLPDLELENVDLVSYLFSNPFKTPPNRPVYIDAVSGNSYTYNDVLQRTRSIAHGLRELGLRPDDVVALLSPNTIDYATICYAVIGCGATVAPMSSALTSFELKSQLETGQMKFLITHSSLFKTASRAAKGTSVQLIIRVDGHSSTKDTPTVHRLASNCPSSDLVSTPSSKLDERAAFLCFSSGTTGKAKAVVITHKNITANMQQWGRQLFQCIDPNQATIAFLPLCHIYGVNLFLCSGFFRGTPTVIMTKFDLDIYLSTIQRYRPQDLALVPPVALLLVKDSRLKKYDLSSVKRIMSAAAPLTSELSTAVESRFKELYATSVHCFQAWGLTETSPLASGVPPDRLDKRDGVGCIAPNMEFRFVDPETMLDMVETDAVGTTIPAEIWVHGPNVTKGYYRNEKETLNAFHVDDDGKTWFKTGDIGTIDKEGFIKIVDRIKEMIKYKGMQVIPSELEGKLLCHPDVEDACVVGVWVEEQATELPLAFVVLNSRAKQKGVDVVAEGIHEWLSTQVANHKRLRGGIKIVNVITKSPSGKILRRQMKDLLKRDRVGVSRL